MTGRGALGCSVLLHGLLAWVWLTHPVDLPVAKYSAIEIILQPPMREPLQSVPVSVSAPAALRKVAIPVMTQSKAAAAVIPKQAAIKPVVMPVLAPELAQISATNSASASASDSVSKLTASSEAIASNMSKATQVSTTEQKITPAQYRAAYLQNPKPEMPYLSKMKGETGRVGLRVKVGIHGEPLAVYIEQSSGFARLDAAAYQTVLEKWRFVPAKIGDTPIEGEVAFGIPFILISK